MSNSPPARVPLRWPAEIGYMYFGQGRLKATHLLPESHCAGLPRSATCILDKDV